jgi:xyloglucan-specific exo-beta-1,4-glucanase
MLQKKMKKGGSSLHYSIGLLLFCFSFISFRSFAQQIPYYTQHQNWDQIKVKWTNSDNEIGKKFLPFLSANLLPNITTRDYPYTYAGRAVSSTFSRNGVFYVGFSSGGLWRMMTYSGQDSISWKMVTDNTLLSQSIGAATVDPSNENYIVVGTGSHENGEGRGIYYTEDAGVSWKLSATPNDIQPNICYAFAWYHQNLYLATSNGLLVSGNKGETWNKVNIAGSENVKVTDVINVQSADQLVAAVSNNGVYIKDTISQWEIMQGSPSDSHIDLACNSNLFYALALPSQILYQTNSNNYAGFKNPFIIVNNKAPGSFNTLQISWGTNRVYMGSGGGNIFRSSDYGRSFTDISQDQNVHVDQRGFAIDPSNNEIVYALCDGGVYRSSNEGFSWSNLNIGLQTFQCTDLESYFGSKQRIYVGTQDNGSQSCVNGFWTIGGGGDGSSNHFALEDSLLVYEIRGAVLGLTVNAQGRGLRDYHSFFFHGEGGRLIWMNSLAVNPKNTDVQYLSTIDGLYKTYNAGRGNQTPNNTSWNLVVDQNQSQYDSYVNYVAVDLVDTAKVYFLNHENGSYVVYKSNNSGKTWSTPVTINGSALFSCESSPNKAGRSFIVGGNNNGANVFLSDGFDSPYKQMPGELPPMQVFDILETPKANTGVVQRFIGNQMGVYWSFGNDGNWFKINGSLPNIQVRKIEFHELTGKLRVATYGRGVWEFPCPIFATTDVSLTQMVEDIYASNGSITVNNNVIVSKPNGEVTLIAQKGISFGNGFSVMKGTGFSAYTFKEIE